jgi:fructosamine-3-kinase
MDQRVRIGIEGALGVRVRAARSVAGGDINEAFELELSDGRRAFAKTSTRLPALAFQEEARGLAWLAESGAVEVPATLAVSHQEPGYLVLQAIARGSPRPSTEEALGRGLAQLHRYGAETFGYPRSNWLATLPQDNSPEADWATFYRARRLEPLLRHADAQGLVSPRLRTRFGQLFEVLSDRVGPPEPPARLHGDLWGGNWIADKVGTPYLIDPAVYGGHREIDLAMMRLFGGFGARVFRAYAETYPLAPGSEERVGLYQLYPLLAHVVMFGAGYVGQLESALETAL